MSRTYKDRHWKLKYPEETNYWGFNAPGYIKVDKFRWIKRPGLLTKKKRSYEPWNWVSSTPSKWTRIMMTRPQRRKCRLWERKVLFSDIEEVDCPYFGKKPHIYYW